MNDETSNLLQFPRLGAGAAQSPEALELIAGITTMLRIADRLAQLTAKAGLDDPQKLLLVTKLKDIVADVFSLYLILMRDDEEARSIRARIEGIIDGLDNL